MSIPGEPELLPPTQQMPVQAVNYRPRARQPWEAYVMSACIALGTAVAAVCFCIFAIALLMFGLAELSAHWPA